MNQPLKGVLTRGFQVFFRNQGYKYPQLYSCPQFLLKHIPKYNYLSAYQKSLPYSLICEFNNKGGPVYNISVKDSAEPDAGQENLKKLMRKSLPSQNPMRYGHYRVAARRAIKKEFARLLPDETKYHGIYLIRFFVVPCEENKVDFTRHLALAFARIGNTSVQKMISNQMNRKVSQDWVNDIVQIKRQGDPTLNKALQIVEGNLLREEMKELKDLVMRDEMKRDKRELKSEREEVISEKRGVKVEGEGI